MKVISGTPDTRTEHSRSAAGLGLMVSVGGPAAIALLGISTQGLDAISWAGAIVWGIVATAVFTGFSLTGKSMGVTRMDLLDLLGSVMARPHSGQSRVVGAVIHHANGAILAVAWAYGTVLLDAQANWASGFVWGAILWGLALLMMTSIGAFHPAIRRGKEEDPGLAATNLGGLTPLGSLIGHLVYGGLLGILYQLWPLT